MKLINYLFSKKYHKGMDDVNKTDHTKMYSKFMSVVAFLVTMFMEIYHLVTGKTTPFFIEIVVTNFVFILSVLGIKGWISSRVLSIQHANGNGGDVDKKENHKCCSHEHTKFQQSEFKSDEEISSQRQHHFKEVGGNIQQEESGKTETRFY
ncbi:MAG: hypothetical protein NZZ41_07930 [Candidatus Dojkabacteria bacterium]|nr:hypothetical protein [Candidatus Dojkabacteria bacterium]